jgi:4-hydroxy-3-polyprenylbenzoate decarboxylase
MRAERDIVIVPGMRTDRSEPMKLGGTIAKYGYDATRRAQDRDDWTRALPPRSAFEQVAAIVSSVRDGQRNIS